MNLDNEPKIIAMARGLGLNASDPVASIFALCRKKIAKALKRVGSIRTIWDLERAICDEMNLVIHHIWSDEELESYRVQYGQEEPAFGSLPIQLEGDSFGVLFQRRIPTEQGEARYVAFVDCRGAKALRQFFTRWHEIAHCLTSYQQEELPLRRTKFDQRDPIERLMDHLAAEFGFFGPLFEPVLQRELQAAGQLTFGVVEAIRSQFCPDASFQATLNACVTRMKTPVLLVEAGMAVKPSEEREALRRGRPGTPCLRVLKVSPNEAAKRAKIFIPPHYRVPTESIIAKALSSPEAEGEIAESFESLSTWTCSDGTNLGDATVLIHARKQQDKVFAVISAVDG